MSEGIAPSRRIAEPPRRRMGITAAISPSVAWKSALFLALFKGKGVHCGLVRRGGHLPTVYAGGEVYVGSEFGLDSRMAPIELGTTEGGVLRIGDRVAVGAGASLVASLEIDLADDVMIGDRVGIFDNDFHASTAALRSGSRRCESGSAPGSAGVRW